MFVNRRGNGNDVAVATPQVFKVCGVAQMPGSDQFFLCGFKSEVFAGFQLVNTTQVDVEPDDGAFTSKFNG